MSEQSAQKHSRTRHLALAGAAVLAIGTIAYLVVPGWSGILAPSADAHVIPPSAHPSAQSTIPGPMPGAPTQVPTPPSLPPGGPRPSPVRPTPTALMPSNPALVRTWNSGPGGKALLLMTTLSSNVLLAEEMGQYSDMLRDCKALTSVAGKDNNAAHIPDVAMQLKYAAAIVSFRLAAVSCIAGIRVIPDGVEDTVISVDQTDMNTVSSDLHSGVSDLFDGTETLRQR